MQHISHTHISHIYIYINSTIVFDVDVCVVSWSSHLFQNDRNLVRMLIEIRVPKAQAWLQLRVATRGTPPGLRTQPISMGKEKNAAETEKSPMPCSFQ